MNGSVSADAKESRSILGQGYSATIGDEYDIRQTGAGEDAAYFDLIKNDNPVGELRFEFDPEYSNGLVSEGDDVISVGETVDVFLSGTWGKCFVKKK